MIPSRHDHSCLLGCKTTKQTLYHDPCFDAPQFLLTFQDFSSKMHLNSVESDHLASGKPADLDLRFSKTGYIRFQHGYLFV